MSCGKVLYKAQEPSSIRLTWSVSLVNSILELYGTPSNKEDTFCFLVFVMNLDLFFNPLHRCDVQSLAMIIAGQQESHKVPIVCWIITRKRNTSDLDNRAKVKIDRFLHQCTLALLLKWKSPEKNTVWKGRGFMGFLYKQCTSSLPLFQRILKTCLPTSRRPAKPCFMGWLFDLKVKRQWYIKKKGKS